MTSGAVGAGCQRLGVDRKSVTRLAAKAPDLNMQALIRASARLARPLVPLTTRRALSATTEGAGKSTTEGSSLIVPACLGVAGLIPFAFFTQPGVRAADPFLPSGLKDLLGGGVNGSYAHELQNLYGASIVSFLGAVHWGVAGTSKAPTLRYLWAVTPSLLAWVFGLGVPAAMKHAAPPNDADRARAQVLAQETSSQFLGMELILCFLVDGWFATKFREYHVPHRGYMLLRTVLTLGASSALAHRFLQGTTDGATKRSEAQ